MAQKKAHEVGRWLARPDPAFCVILLYGPDRGMVSERASAFAAATGLPLDDPFAVAKFDISDIETDPGRLFDEIATRPLFGGKRLVWLRNAGTQKFLADAVTDLAKNALDDVILLIEAGELRKNAPLRMAAEQATAAMALPCYADEGRNLDQLVDGELQKAGLTIGPDARHYLRGILGGDRLASRGELEKLMLYCQGGGEISVADIRESVGDVSATSTDDVVDCVLAGSGAEMDRQVRRLLAAGTPPFLMLSAAMRQFQTLSALRDEMDRSGRKPGAVVASARPPIFFARRAVMETALLRWSAGALAEALARLQATVLQTRQQPELAASLTRQLLLSLCLFSARAR